MRAEVVVGEGTFLISERGTTRLRGRLLESLAPLLDGTRDLRELVRDSSDGSAAEIGNLVGSLSSAGLLSFRGSVPRQADGRAEGFWEAAGLDGPATVRALADARVRVVGADGTDPGPTAAFEAAGLRVTDATDADLTVVLCRDYLSGALAAVEAERRAAGGAWMLARTGGTEIWTGPFFDPRDEAAACWHCMAHRLRDNRPEDLTVQRALALTDPPTCPEASLPSTRALGLHLAAVRAQQWLAGLREPGHQSIHTFDLLRPAVARHAVLRDPRCPSCSGPAAAAAHPGPPRPVVLRPVPKASRAGNGHRALTPQQVLDRYGHLVSPVSGLIGRISRAAHCPDGVHSYVAQSALAPVGRSPLRRISGGKGATELDARVSALCEALEHRSGALHGGEPRVRATLRELGDRALHPNTCQLYDERQFADRERWNADHSLYQYVTERFDPDVPVDWSPVWSLTRRREVLLPTALLYYGPHPPGTGARWARADSNGCAAGSSLEDAILQGFLELVERDAVALWWYNRTRHPRVDLAALGDPWLDQAPATHRRLGRRLWALDLTADLGVPVVVAVSARTGGGPQQLSFGFGAHFDLVTAARRAVAECEQLLPAAAAAGRGRTDGVLADPVARAWFGGATTEAHPYLLPDPAAAPSGPGRWPWPASSCLKQDVETAERLVAAHGMELLVLEQTRPEIGLPVVRVLVPGLRHFWARFAPGRLFDVPVRLGRLAEPTPYERLNPVPLFL
nr:TOMM precursor leader peptide-binding protein [Kitasatospora sp. SID7827]